MANFSIASKCNSSFYVNRANSSYPTQLLPEDDGLTIATSNVSTSSIGSYKARALSALLQNKEFVGSMFQLNKAAAIADSDATQIFVMEGAKDINKRRTIRPLKMTLAD